MGEAEGRRVVVVTGGARGIGRSIVERFSSAGWTVAVLDINEKAIAALRAEAGWSPDRPPVEVHRVSISDRSEVQRCIDGVVSEHGRLDALVNNAGMTLPATFLDQADEDWDRILEVNLTGTFVISQVVARHMVGVGRGAIVHISSVSAHGVRTGPPAYAAAKAGVEGLSRLMAVQLGGQGVTVNCVVVGTTATPWLLGRKSAEELDEIAASTLTGSIGTPDDVAATVAFLTSDDARHITGQLLSVSGGQWLP